VVVGVGMLAKREMGVGGGRQRRQRRRSEVRFWISSEVGVEGFLCPLLICLLSVVYHQVHSSS